MPTKREREYYRMGFRDGLNYVKESESIAGGGLTYKYEDIIRYPREDPSPYVSPSQRASRKLLRPKRKLSAWNKYVKNKRNHIRYRDGKLNLKKMAVAFRRKKRR